MNRFEHLLIGFVTGILLIFAAHYFLNWFDFTFNLIFVYIIIMAVYSLLPDADHRNSTISYVFIGASILGIAIGYNYHNNIILYSFFFLLVTTFIAWTIGHRGFVHSLLFDLIVSFPLIYFFNYQVAILGFACFYSHLAADEEFFKLI